MKVDWKQWDQLQSWMITKVQAENGEAWHYPGGRAVGTAQQGCYEVYVMKMSGGISDWMDMGVKEKRRSGCVTGVEPG